ncbi:MAG: hypothetical protein IB618_02485 [Candidatus Pacearchaeota archaeon]|nr:MAG: hypothetical protein IB618_02485 [Candidatus Pacearchaeota archaeon]
MRMKELRQIIEKFPKRKGTQNINQDPIVNEGYPGTFNSSYSEGYWSELFGPNLEIYDLIVHKIQPCIRFSDFINKILKDTSKIHLSCFDMGDISGAVNFTSSKNHKRISRENVNAMLTFLTNLGFKLLDIYITCFPRGNLNEISKLNYGRESFNFYIKPDPNIDEFKKFLPKENIILTKKDTFLCIDLEGFNKTLNGYRNEILFKTNKGMIDIGTMENLYLMPQKENNKIRGYINKGLFSIAGIGLERVLLCKNNFNHIIECDHIYPLYQQILKDFKKKDEHGAFIYTESLRSLHRVFSENNYRNLSKNRKRKVKKFLQQIYHISKENIKNYLEINAQLQDYYPELKKGIENTNNEIIGYFERRKSSFLERKLERKNIRNLGTKQKAVQG